MIDETMTTLPRRNHWSYRTLTHFVLPFLILIASCHANDRLDGRFSFSLTTFDRLGKLVQVERATRAASLGTPVVAICRSDGIVMACPQVFPSPFIMDDGTARFCRINHNIAVTHSGVSADGRVIVAAAQRMAVEHAYTFDEPIPIESFLEEVSLLFQEYTMKPGSRPFGCTLLVAYVPSGENEGTPRLYRIDPSGSVESMGSCAVIGSLEKKAGLSEALEGLANEESGRPHQKDQAELVLILKDSIRQSALASPGKIETRISFLVASLTPQEGLIVRRESAPSTNISQANGT
jgi:20S proteasome alpha/beta subunit